MPTFPSAGDHHHLVAALPKDILVDVLARVASQSPADLVSAKLTCKALLEASGKNYIYRHVNIAEFPVISWKSDLSRVLFIDRCITSGNPEALFRRGLIEYLSTLEIDSGLRHLGSAARSGHPESVYIYGLLMLCQGQQEEGMALLRSLKGGSRWLEMVRYCRERVSSVVRYRWVRNFTILAGPEQNRGRICSCRQERFAVLPSPESMGRGREGWASKEDAELDFYAINRCRSCFWNHEAAALCTMLRCGSWLLNYDN
ncbi:unnamed protein product [Linum tenue]|uniref:At2g35280-like TPR domain-containing protein n=1 Tax=Linum tenue TaxID=586396 RepID=A0AAV0NQ81_9ROSI|nr:unnamed protein product [Linum tenue]